jgi:hypothetical protein
MAQHQRQGKMNGGAHFAAEARRRENGGHGNTTGGDCGPLPEGRWSRSHGPRILTDPPCLRMMHADHACMPLPAPIAANGFIGAFSIAAARARTTWYVAFG